MDAHRLVGLCGNRRGVRNTLGNLDHRRNGCGIAIRGLVILRHLMHDEEDDGEQGEHERDDGDCIPCDQRRAGSFHAESRTGNPENGDRHHTDQACDFEHGKDSRSTQFLLDLPAVITRNEHDLAGTPGAPRGRLVLAHHVLADPTGKRAGKQGSPKSLGNV